MKQNETKTKDSNSLQKVIFCFLLGIFLLVCFFLWSTYQGQKKIEVEIEEVQLLEGVPVEIVFSGPMLKSSVIEGMTVDPPLQVETHWKGSRALSVIPTETPVPDSTYQISFLSAKSRSLISQEALRVSFDSERSPVLEEVYPKQGQDQVKADEKIELSLDKSLGDDFELEVKVDPISEFNFWLDEKKEKVTLESKTGLKKGAEYDLTIKVKHKQLEDFEKTIYQGGFKTKEPMKVVYSLDKEGNALKSEPRKEEFVPKITEGKVIQVDLSSQTMILYQDGEEKNLFKVSSGKRGMDTPIGTFPVMAKALKPWSARYELYMPYFIQFTNEGHGLHELPEWPGGYKEGAAHLGYPVSHGCVRMGIGAAKIVYDFAQVGTPIVIER